MTAAYCYNPNRFRKAQGDDWQSWLSLFDVISSNVTFIDRTANIINPIRSTLPTFLAMPAYDPGFAMTYKECCQSAAQRLLALQESLDVPIRILYSGGIDSSLVLTSFINQLGQQAAERRIQIVMSVESIEENPWMWERLLRRSGFTLINGEAHAGDWDASRILVGGEFNDQLHGSDIYRDLVRWRGDSILDTRYSQGLISEYLRSKIPAQYADTWTAILHQHMQKAPCPIDTVADFWWWLNFSCKWSSVYFRILSHARDTSLINDHYCQKHYFQFYGTDDFQRWSMVDRMHKHQGSWVSYKWHAKQLVAKLCGDEYNQKLKRGSLWRLLSYRRGADIVDDAWQFHDQISIADWYDPNNSFRMTNG